LFPVGGGIESDRSRRTALREQEHAGGGRSGTSRSEGKGEVKGTVALDVVLLNGTHFGR